LELVLVVKRVELGQKALYIHAFLFDFGVYSLSKFV